MFLNLKARNCLPRPLPSLVADLCRAPILTSRCKVCFGKQKRIIKTEISRAIQPFVNVMACEIRWLRRASNELDAIFQFYSEFASRQVAQRRLGKILHSIGNLHEMPYIGMQDEEFTEIKAYRYLIVLTYKVYYFVEDNNVYIASIWDCRQGGKAF